MVSKILVLGSLAYDNIMAFEGLHLESYSADPSKQKFYLSVMPRNRWMNFGGVGGNICYNLALMGAPVQLITSAGKDYTSGGYAAHHKQFPNLDVKIDIQPDEFTASAYIVNDRLNNLVNIFHPGALSHSAKISLAKKGVSKENIRIACVSPDDVGAMIQWTRELKALGIPFLFDPGQVTGVFSPEVLQEILPNAFLLIGNEFEIGIIEKKLNTNLTGLRKIIPRIIITKGEEGSICYEKDMEYVIKIVPPKSVVDPTGCGDGYRSGLLYGLANGASLKQSSQIGSTISSFVIETAGPQTQKYGLDDVKQRYKATYNEDFPVK